MESGHASIPDTPEAREALTFLKRFKTGVLATLGEDGQPHASLIYYTCTSDCRLYLTTLSVSRKLADIERDPRVAFTVAAEDAPQTVQIEGKAEILFGATDQPYLGSILQTLSAESAYFPPPAIKLSPHDDLVIVEVHPLWIRWSDFTGEHARVVQILP